MLSQVSKVLLKNVIRHTDTHNRIVEEDEMWRQRDSGTTSKRKHRSYRSRMSPQQELQGAHMDRSPDRTMYAERGEDSMSNGRSTYWMQQLYTANENDPDRWGHSGYKELYPDLFNSKRVSIESESDTSSPERKHKKKKKSKSPVKKKNKKDKKTKKDKKVKHRSTKSKSSQNHSALKSPHNERDTKYRKRRISRSRSNSSIESSPESHKRRHSRSPSGSSRTDRKHRLSSDSPQHTSSDSNRYLESRRNIRSTKQPDSSRKHKDKGKKKVQQLSSSDSVIEIKRTSSRKAKKHKRSEHNLSKRKKRDKFRTYATSSSSSDSE